MIPQEVGGRFRKRNSMYARVIRQKVRPGGMAALAAAAAEGRVPDISQSPGVVAHYVIDFGPESYVTISVFRSKEDADEWSAKARDHAEREHLRQYLDDSPDATSGFSGNVLVSYP
jgi:heme-degrading monooxygenase HmoA